MSKDTLYDWVIWFLCMVVIIGVFGYMGWQLAEPRVVYLVNQPSDTNAIQIPAPPP